MKNKTILSFILLLIIFYNYWSVLNEKMVTSYKLPSSKKVWYDER